MSDSCYSFWIGCTLSILGYPNLLDHDKLTKFLDSCESQETGGYSKYPKNRPDVVHALHSLLGMSIETVDCLLAVNKVIN